MDCRFKILSLSLIAFLFCANTHAQSSFSYSGGAKTYSLANTGSAFTGIESIYTNPAGLTSIDNYAFDVNYIRRFNLNELSTISFAGAKNVGFGTVGLQVSKYGLSSYSENRIGLSFAKNIFRNTSIGGSFHYLGFNIDQYGSASRFTFDFGVLAAVNDKISIGAYIFSPGSIGLTDDQDVPSRISLGMSYKASQKATIYVDISKSINRDPDIKFSVDYALIDNFSIRSGANITQSSIHFGPSFRLMNGLTINGAYSFNNRLGHTTGLSISWVK